MRCRYECSLSIVVGMCGAAALYKLLLILVLLLLIEESFICIPIGNLRSIVSCSTACFGSVDIWILIIVVLGGRERDRRMIIDGKDLETLYLGDMALEGSDALACLRSGKQSGMNQRNAPLRSNLIQLVSTYNQVPNLDGTIIGRREEKLDSRFRFRRRRWSRLWSEARCWRSWKFILRWSRCTFCGIRWPNLDLVDPFPVSSEGEAFGSIEVPDLKRPRRTGYEEKLECQRIEWKFWPFFSQVKRRTLILESELPLANTCLSKQRLITESLCPSSVLKHFPVFQFQSLILLSIEPVMSLTLSNWRHLTPLVW
jgi:hypothetical protein